jgi:hypothetical protein
MPRVDGNKDLVKRRIGKDGKRQRYKLYVPDLPIVYKTNKIYQLLQVIEKKMEDDPLYISIKDYIYLISELEQCNEELVKRGLNTANGRAKARMEQQKLDKSRNPKSEARVGENKSVGVDNGVPTSNPFA